MSSVDAITRAAKPGAPSAGPAAPGGDVHDLVPFVHVADVRRSIEFYERLGFEVDDTHAAGERLDWASLRSGRARLMLAQAGMPVVAEDQAVLFYLYSDDLAALRERLHRAGVAAGPIRDGSPGPRREMRVADPDGYVLLIAQSP